MPTLAPHSAVIPAEAGIQPYADTDRCWIPAFAGMTKVGNVRGRHLMPLMATFTPHSDVIPAQAGIQYPFDAGDYWVPASAGKKKVHEAYEGGTSCC
jgi:hypothetical protein